MTGDLRERLAEALGDSIARWWQTPPRLDLAADAVLHVIESHVLAAHVDATERADTLTAQLQEALDLLRELADDRPCDPHPGNGWCQTHREKPPCPHAAAKKLLTTLDTDQPKETR